MKIEAEAGEKGVAALLLKQGVMLALATILRPGHFDALHAWPASQGGGRDGTSQLLDLVCGLLTAPLDVNRKPQGDLMQLQEVRGCMSSSCACYCAWHFSLARDHKLRCSAG